MLFVHHFLVGAELKAKDARQKETEVVDPLGLEGVAVEEFVLAGKGEALELKAVKEVERKKDNKFQGETLIVERKDIHSMDSKCRERHDDQVSEETLESFVVGLLHEFDQDATIEDAIALLALARTMLNFSPVFVICRPSWKGHRCTCSYECSTILLMRDDDALSLGQRLLRSA
jgi:hypothetical protein